MLYNCICLIINNFRPIFSAIITHLHLLVKKLMFIRQAIIRPGLCDYYEDLEAYSNALVWHLITLNNRFKELTEEIDRLKEKDGHSTQTSKMQAQAIITLEDQSLLEIKKTWLDYKINQINSSSFGADTIYELQVSRKQDAIECLIEENEAVLTQAEIDEIKHKTEYIENFEPYTELDEETGQLLSIETIAHKMAYWDAC